MKVSNRFLQRAKPALRKYQGLLAQARDRDINESDTCVIVSDFVADVLGWDKYAEVTTEFAIRSTFCDLALKLDGHPVFLIEVKSAGTDLRDNHLRQAIDYAANSGIEWVLLTNGLSWKAHRIRFEKPIDSDEVFAVDLLGTDLKPGALLEHLYLISREGAQRSDITKYWQHKEATSRYVVAQLLLGGPGLLFLRRSFRQMYKGIKVTDAQLDALLRGEVLKRDVLEGDRANAAEKLVKRRTRKRAKEQAEPVASSGAAEAPPASA
jgi:hypothetical protein